MKHHQARRSNGRFTRNTLENTFGISADVCRGVDEWCGRILPRGMGEAKRELCDDCARRAEKRSRK